MGKQYTGSGNKKEYKSKETIMDYSNYIDKKIVINFTGGREIIGVLQGFDQVSNIVLDKAEEIMKDKLTSKEIRRRNLGIVIVRGPNVLLFYKLIRLLHYFHLKV